MEISKATYLRYKAGVESLNEFFDAHIVIKDQVGFCSMMRTIYFWRPAIVAARVLLISTTLAIGCTAWYFFSMEIILGAVEIALVVGFIWVCKLLMTVVGIKVYFEPENMPLLFQWAKASHDKICPLVPLAAFIAEEEEAATCEE